MDKSFLAELSALNHFVELCHHGLGVATQAQRMIATLERSPNRFNRPPLFGSTEERAETLRRAEALESFAQGEQAVGFPFLYGLASIKLWALLEAHIDDLVVEHVRKHTPKAFLALSRLKGTLVDFLDATDEERLEILISRLKDSTDAPQKKGVGRFESLLGAVELGGGVSDLPRKYLLELSEVRNLLVHRNATADQRFKRACPWFAVRPGEPVVLTADRYRAYDLASCWYFLEVERRTYVHDGEPVPSDYADLLDFLLSKLNEVAKKLHSEPEPLLEEKAE